MEKITLPIKKGTKTAYNALVTKDAGTLYILTDVADENNMFLGAVPVGKGSNGKVVKNVSFDSAASVFTYTFTDGRINRKKRLPTPIPG